MAARMDGVETRKRPVVWSIAGSDSGGGAGVQADLRALDAFDVHACTAIAAITAQNSLRVTRVDAVATDLLDAQLATLADDLPPLAIKTGLLGSADNVRCVAQWVDRLRRVREFGLVVDPVWRASTGADLAGAALRDALLGELLPRASAITPNRAEAAWLLGWDAAAMAEPAAVEAAAAALRALGPVAVVITGGDAGGDRALDFISTPEATGWLALPRMDAPHHHGSGCVFASSLAAALARDFCTADAAVLAKMATAQALRHGSAAGTGAGIVRPRHGFALHADTLPTLHDSATRWGDSTATAFPALVERQMGLYGVVDSAAAVVRVLAAGVRTVQLRIKEGSPEALSQAVALSVAAAREAHAQLFVNDHWQLAIEHGAYGVHLGQDDLRSADLDALRIAGLRLGVSTHSPWEVCRAHGLAPSYIACGPVHATTTKAMPWRPQGAGNLAFWCHVLREPVVAIAGMDVDRSREAARCGAAGVAVLRGLQVENPAPVIAALQSAIETGLADEAASAPLLPVSTFAGMVEPG